MHQSLDPTSFMAIIGLLLAFGGIPLGSFTVIAIGFILMESAIAIWLWMILTS